MKAMAEKFDKEYCNTLTLQFIIPFELLFESIHIKINRWWKDDGWMDNVPSINAGKYYQLSMYFN